MKSELHCALHPSSHSPLHFPLPFPLSLRSLHLSSAFRLIYLSRAHSAQNCDAATVPLFNFKRLRQTEARRGLGLIFHFNGEAEFSSFSPSLPPSFAISVTLLCPTLGGGEGRKGNEARNGVHDAAAANLSLPSQATTLMGTGNVRYFATSATIETYPHTHACVMWFGGRSTGWFPLYPVPPSMEEEEGGLAFRAPRRSSGGGGEAATYFLNDKSNPIAT